MRNDERTKKLIDISGATKGRISAEIRAKYILPFRMSYIYVKKYICKQSSQHFTSKSLFSYMKEKKCKLATLAYVEQQITLMFGNLTDHPIW